MLIRVSSLTKDYLLKDSDDSRGKIKSFFSPAKKKLRAVNGISFNISNGEVIGFIGENGAGKSTTIKMMCGILTPTSGSVLINGYNPRTQRKKVAQNIGVVFGQKTQLFWDIPVVVSFDLLKDIYSIPNSIYKKRLNELISELHLSTIINQPVRQLSLGQRVRAEIAAAFLHNPEVVFLDEPTIGLDIHIKNIIRDFIIRENKRHGTTVLITSHDVSDIETLCSRIIILDSGNIIFDGTKEEIFKKFENKKVIKLRRNDVELVIPKTLKKKVVKKSSNKYLFSTKTTSSEHVLIDLVKSNPGIANDIHISDFSLEDIIEYIYANGD